MISAAVELLKGRCSGSIFSLDFLPVGMEVPHQRHGSDIETGLLFCAMEVSHGVKESVLIIHQSIQGIGGAIGTGMIVGFLEVSGMSPQIPQFFSDGRGHLLRGNPLAETTQPLSKRSARWGMIHRPDSVLQFPE